MTWWKQTTARNGKLQNLGFFKEISGKTKFKTVKEGSIGEVFYLENCM
jgi:hypothetical protein